MQEIYIILKTCFSKGKEKSNRIFGNISFVDIKSSNFVNYSNVFIQKNFTQPNWPHEMDFMHSLVALEKREQFVAIWSRLPRSYDKVGQGVRDGALKGKPS